MDMQDFLKEIEKKLGSVDVTPKAKNTGEVLSVADGIITASGLSDAGFGEEVEFEDGSRGLVFNLDEDHVSIILLSSLAQIVEGSKVTTTGRILGVNASESLMGRVIDPLQNPLDGKALKVTGGKFYPLERIAPGVIARQPVDTPLKQE